MNVLIPDLMKHRALQLGELGKTWLNNVDGLLDDVATSWDLDVGLQLNGGTEALVFATSRDAGVCVLKLGIPNSLGGEIEVLRKAGGRGYAMLLEFDSARDAILIERLGSQLAEAPISVTEQIKIIRGTLSLGWQQLESVDGLVTGAEKAQADCILTEWQKLDRPCPLPIVDLALAFASQ